MPECKLEMESPYVFLILVITLLLSLAFTVHASGSYMNAVRSGTSVFNMKTQTTEVTFSELPLPTISDKNHLLRENDAKYALCNGIDIRELTISQIQALFSNNKLTSVELTNCYLLRILRMDPVLKAVIEVNPDAITEANKADKERNSYKKIRGPLHGIPVLLKDNIGTADFMETTAGSLALLGIRPKKDADVVKLLRKSGAVIIGKSNLSEFAYFRGTNVPSGWSGRGGQTRNAYNLNVTPQGSSSGSAVAVSTNLVTVAVGSETDGSLIAPSSVGGICSLKPTHDLISTNVVIPISHNQDTLGPMARTVLDVAILLDAMLPSGKRPACGGSYAQCVLQAGNTNKFRIGVLRYPFWDLSVINSTNLRFELPLLENILHNMQNSLQFEVVDPVVSNPGQLVKVSSSNELTVLLHDFKFGINKYLRDEIISPFQTPIKPSSKYLPSKTTTRRIASLQDIIEFNQEHPSVEGYNQELLLLSEATDGLNNRTYQEARDSNRGAARELLDTVLSRYKLDAIVVPSEPRYESILDENLQDSPVTGYSIAAIAGYPSISIPAGIGLKDVPFGMTFIAMPRAEATILQIAHAVEQMEQGPKRKFPRFLE